MISVNRGCIRHLRRGVGSSTHKRETNKERVGFVFGQTIVKWSIVTRGGKIGPARWASPVRSKLGPGWAIKFLA